MIPDYNLELREFAARVDVATTLFATIDSTAIGGITSNRLDEPAAIGKDRQRAPTRSQRHPSCPRIAGLTAQPGPESGAQASSQR